MGTMRILLSAMVVVLVAACGNVSRNYRFDPGGTNGLVVGSISYESGLGRYFLTAESSETSRKYDFGFGCPVWPCTQPADDAAFSNGEVPEQRGGGFVVAVPEGTYRITGWRVQQGSIASRSEDPVDIEFTVERGKASYLGNLHFDSDWADVRLRDRAGRDLPLLHAKYPVLQSAELAYTIAPGTDLAKIGGGYDRSLSHVIIFMPVAR